MLMNVIHEQRSSSPNTNPWATRSISEWKLWAKTEASSNRRVRPEPSCRNHPVSFSHRLCPSTHNLDSGLDLMMRLNANSMIVLLVSSWMKTFVVILFAARSRFERRGNFRFAMEFLKWKIETLDRVLGTLNVWTWTQRVKRFQTRLWVFFRENLGRRPKHCFFPILFHEPYTSLPPISPHGPLTQPMFKLISINLLINFS